MTSTLNRDDARKFYDRFGAKQDRQGFYEDAPLEALIAHGGFESAQSVFEIGCGTGRLAAWLLSNHLPATARYVGIDLSATMTDLARERLKPWAGRAVVHQSHGDFDFTAYGGTFDRVISTYVFDLLSLMDISAALNGSHRVIMKDGLLCVAGLTKGTGPVSGVTSKIWEWIQKLRPAMVGGCRPLILSDLMPENQWRIVHKEVVVSTAIPSEVIIAKAL